MFFEYLTSLCDVICSFLLDYFYFTLNINMFTPFFLTEKDLSLETFSTPQFQFSVSCYFEILDLYILAVFGFWITLMSLAPICSFIISLYCHTYYGVFQAFWILSQPLFFINIWFLFQILFVQFFELPLLGAYLIYFTDIRYPGTGLSVSLLNKQINLQKLQQNILQFT